MTKVHPKQREASFIFDEKLLGPVSNQNSMPKSENTTFTMPSGPFHLLCFLFTTLGYGSFYMMLTSKTDSVKYLGIVLFCFAVLMYIFETRDYCHSFHYRIERHVMNYSKFRETLTKPPVLRYCLECYLLKQKANIQRKKQQIKLEYSECKDMSMIPAIKENKITAIKIVNSRVVFSNTKTLKIFQKLKEKLLEEIRVPSGIIEERVKIDTGLHNVFIILPDGKTTLHWWLKRSTFWICSVLSLSWFYRMLLKFKMDMGNIFIQKRIKLEDTA